MPRPVDHGLKAKIYPEFVGISVSGAAPERALLYRARFTGGRPMSLNDIIAYWITVGALVVAVFHAEPAGVERG